MALTAPPSASIVAKYRKRTPSSAACHDAATALLPGGNTRDITFYAPYPTYMVGGKAGVLHDVDGNEYLDFNGNQASLVHGHSHPKVLEAVCRQAAAGTAHGAPTEAITALAAEIIRRIPSIERLRFANSGSEAVMHAIRAARAATGRPKILKMEGAYHGSYDGIEVGVGVPSLGLAIGRIESAGVPSSLGDSTLVAPYNNERAVAAAVDAHAHELAAVIVEPMLGRGSIPATPGFLETLRQVTERHGVLLMFDEIQTFRLGWGGGQALYRIRPDLTVLGKVIGGGFPVGAFGGRKDVMMRYAPGAGAPLHQSGTFNGNAMTMAAGLATLELLTESEVERLSALGECLRQQLRAVISSLGVQAAVTGTGSFAWIHLRTPPVTDAREARRARTELAPVLHLALLNRGVFLSPGPRFVVSTATTEEDLAAAVTAFGAALEEVTSFESAA